MVKPKSLVKVPRKGALTIEIGKYGVQYKIENYIFALMLIDISLDLNNSNSYSVDVKF